MNIGLSGRFCRTLTPLVKSMSIENVSENWRNGLLAFSAICESSGSDYSRVTKNISGENRMLQFNHVELDSSLFSIVGSADVFELSFP